MSGLDKIKDRILGDAEKTAEGILEDADKEAAEIKSKAVREADDLSKQITKKADQDLVSFQERVDSSIDMDRRMRLLSAKQEMIRDVIDEARNKISTLSVKEYFGLLLKLIELSVRKGESGTLYFSGKDLARMPEGFEKAAADAAAEAGGTVAVSKEPRDIGDGFVLSYGGIEENCTFDAMIAAKKDDLTDIVQTILFS